MPPTDIQPGVSSGESLPPGRQKPLYSAEGRRVYIWVSSVTHACPMHQTVPILLGPVLTSREDFSWLFSLSLPWAAKYTWSQPSTQRLGWNSTQSPSKLRVYWALLVFPKEVTGQELEMKDVCHHLGISNSRKNYVVPWNWAQVGMTRRLYYAIPNNICRVLSLPTLC